MSAYTQFHWKQFFLLSQGLTTNKPNPLFTASHLERNTKHIAWYIYSLPLSLRKAASDIRQEACIRFHSLIDGLQIQHFPLKWTFWNSTSFIFKVKILAGYTNKDTHQHLISNIWVFAQDAHICGWGYLHPDFFQILKRAPIAVTDLAIFPTFTIQQAQCSFWHGN